MLLEEFFPDSGSVKSDESRDKNLQESSENIKNKYSDTDDDDNKDNSDESSDLRSNGDGSSDFGDRGITTKTVLPFELEQLVKEALAEMKPMG